MITVSILINGNPIFTRTAKNTETKSYGKGIQKYKLDTGEVVENKFEDGAIKLAIKMLKTIKEIK